MSIKTLPPTLEEAHALIEQLQWRVGQLEKQIYCPKSERAPSTEENLSKEQILMSLFPPPAEPPAASQVAVEGDAASTEPEKKVPRQRKMSTPAARALETITERLEPAEKVCPHCGKDKCEIGCERSERFENKPMNFPR